MPPADEQAAADGQAVTGGDARAAWALATPAAVGFAGDWHGNGAWARSAIEHAAGLGASVVVHLGDFGYTFEAAYMTVLDEALAAAGIPLLFVDGNHESFPILYRYPVRANGLRQLTDWVWHLPRGLSWTWGGMSLLALGGAHSVDRPWRRPGSSWWPQEAITEADIERACAGGRVDVLITHDCPAGVVIPGLARFTHLWPPDELVSANENRQRLRRVADGVRPRVIWHGHYHTHYHLETDLGFGPVRVHGLACDGTSLDANVAVVALGDLVPDRVAELAEVPASED